MYKETKENYLKTVFKISIEKGKVRNIDLANAMSVSKPTVTSALHQLEEDGFITLDKEWGILLTDLGRDIALSTLERHRTFKTILTELGVDDETADRDACALEHCVSDESYAALVKIKDMLKGNAI